MKFRFIVLFVIICLSVTEGTDSDSLTSGHLKRLSSLYEQSEITQKDIEGYLKSINEFEEIEDIKKELYKKIDEAAIGPNKNFLDNPKLFELMVRILQKHPNGVNDLLKLIEYILRGAKISVIDEDAHRIADEILKKFNNKTKLLKSDIEIIAIHLSLIAKSFYHLEPNGHDGSSNLLVEEISIAFRLVLALLNRGKRIISPNATDEGDKTMTSIVQKVQISTESLGKLLTQSEFLTIKPDSVICLNRYLKEKENSLTLSRKAMYDWQQYIRTEGNKLVNHKRHIPDSDEDKTVITFFENWENAFVRSYCGEFSTNFNQMSNKNYALFWRILKQFRSFPEARKYERLSDFQKTLFFMINKNTFYEMDERAIIVKWSDIECYLRKAANEKQFDNNIFWEFDDLHSMYKIGVPWKVDTSESKVNYKKAFGVGIVHFYLEIQSNLEWVLPPKLKPSFKRNVDEMKKELTQGLYDEKIDVSQAQDTLNKLADLHSLQDSQRESTNKLPAKTKSKKRLPDEDEESLLEVFQRTLLKDPAKLRSLFKIVVEYGGKEFDDRQIEALKTIFLRYNKNPENQNDQSVTVAFNSFKRMFHK